MATAHHLRREGLEHVPVQVFACLISEELRIVLYPGAGHADGGIPRDVPIRLIPWELPLPNTPLWVQLDDDTKVVRAWPRRE
jgi:hypothetical protein